MFHHVLSSEFVQRNLCNKMEENNELVFASFNQDTTSLAVGTTSGYKLYSLTSTDSLEPIYSNGIGFFVYLYYVKAFIYLERVSLFVPR